MSFGDNTPITSSDDDDDIIHGNETLGGNFTITHLDGNETPHSDDNDDDIMNDNNDNFINIHYEGTLEKFPITNHHETLSDLRQLINARNDMEMGESHYFLLPHNNDNNYYDDEDEEKLLSSGRLIPIDGEHKPLQTYNTKTLSIYWKSFNLQIMDGIDLQLSVRVSSDWTIHKLKEEISATQNIKINQLSHNGMELIDSDTLSYHGINKTGFTLIS
eukprot:UN02854